MTKATTPTTGRGPRCTLAALALVAGAVSGCGGHDSAASATARAAASPTHVQTVAPSPGLPARLLDARVGNAMRAAFRQRSFLRQLPGSPGDLGQDRPIELLQDVRCSASGVTRTCDARWRSVAGRLHGQRYRVDLAGSSCFVAQADPAREQVFDANNQAPVEDPLNMLAGLSPCR